MIKTVIKRNGSTEEFQADKLNKWVEWSDKAHGAGWSEIVLKVVSSLPEQATSKQIQEAAIKFCLNKRTWAANQMAGRLYAALMLKDIHGSDKYPTVKEVHDNLFKDGLMVKLDYSDLEYKQVESFINHNLNFQSAHYSLQQCRTKYALRNKKTGKEYETPQFVYMRMAMALAEQEPKETRMKDVERFYYYFSNKIINCPTPYYVNLGTNLNGYASCAVYSAGDTWKSLAAGDHFAYAMTAMSAGIGTHIKTRSIGDPIRGGLIQHQGKIPYYRSVVAAVSANLQNGRGGASTVHYTCFDPEAETIEKLKNPMTPLVKQVRGVDYSLGTNKFFARKAAKDEDVRLFSYLEAPDLYEAQYSKDQSEFERLYDKYEKEGKLGKKVKARQLILGALQEGFETGRFYLHFMDAMNQHTPFKENIYSSNLCVAPETLVLTDNGYHQIANLEGENVNVWNGKEWSEVVVKKTGENQKLIKVVTDSGFELECTPYHKFYVVKNYGSATVEKRAHELKAGDKLLKSNFPVINGSNDLEYAYENGFYSADGCLTKQGQRLYFYHEKRGLKEFVDKSIFKNWVVQENNNREYGHTDLLKDKFFVPLDNYSVASKIKWLEGFLDGDGVVCRNGKTQSIQATSVDKKFLLDIQLMLQTVGVYSKVTKTTEAGYRYLPANDGSGEMQQFWCQEAWRIMLGQTAIVTLQSLGFSPKRLQLTDHQPNRECSQFVKVTDVIDEGRVDDTFCFNEPKRHMGVFNGILTGQCQEIMLPTKPFNSVEDLYKPFEEGNGEAALCSLAGIIPSRIKSDDEYAEACYYALKMIDIGIHKSEYVFKSVEESAKARMSAGVGLVGLAHYMALNGKKYNDEDGLKFIHETIETHTWHLINASLQLGKEKGNAKWMHKTYWPDGWLPIDTYEKKVDSIVKPEYKRDWEDLRKKIIANGGIRNSVVCAIMPAESSSVASETTNSVYPIRDFDLVKTNDTNAVNYVVPDAEELKDKYQIAWDIKTEDLIKVYAVLQKFTDQGISADLYRKMQGIEKVGTAEMLSNYLAMVRYGIKTRYYQNSLIGKTVNLNASEDKQVQSAEQEESSYCESCAL